MHATPDDMKNLRHQLGHGSIQRAYRALISYMANLRTHFRTKYPKYSVSGLYHSYLDLTYFAYASPALKRRRLKIAIVFNYAPFRFEAWLSGRNRQVLLKHWDLFKNSRWSEYRLVEPTATGVDSIVESTLAEETDFTDLDSLTAAIDKNAAKFTRDMEAFLSRRQTKSRAA
jgi:hypothetical protein